MKSSTALSTAIRTSSRSSDPGGGQGGAPMKRAYMHHANDAPGPRACGAPRPMRVTEPEAAAGPPAAGPHLSADFCVAHRPGQRVSAKRQRVLPNTYCRRVYKYINKSVKRLAGEHTIKMSTEKSLRDALNEIESLNRQLTKAQKAEAQVCEGGSAKRDFS